MYAQRPNMGGFGGKNASLHNGQISGKLVDAKSGEELAFANVKDYLEKMTSLWRAQLWMKRELSVH